MFICFQMQLHFCKQLAATPSTTNGFSTKVPKHKCATLLYGLEVHKQRKQQHYIELVQFLISPFPNTFDSIHCILYMLHAVAHCTSIHYII
jgi:hypothetical protein